MVGVGDDFIFALIDMAGYLLRDPAALGKDKRGAILEYYSLQFRGEVSPEGFLVFLVTPLLRGFDRHGVALVVGGTKDRDRPFPVGGFAPVLHPFESANEVRHDR